MIVRGTSDKLGFCVYGELYLLNKRYMPNTHARKIQSITEEVRLNLIKDARRY